MICTERVNNRHCSGTMKPGKVFVERWCRRGVPVDEVPAPRGTTLNPGKPVLKKAMKCTTCGHTVFFGNPNHYSEG